MVKIAAAEIDLAPLIDLALLHPNATVKQLRQWCETATRFHFAAVCVYPCHVRQAVEYVRGKQRHSRSSETKVSAVIGFPTGLTTPSSKLYEAQEVADWGAEELEVVINRSFVHEGTWDAVHREIAQIVEVTGCPVKAILEMTLLTEIEQRTAAEVCMDAGAAFLKTGTGWHGGATVADVGLLKQITKDRIGIKAAGGIQTAEQAIALVMAGATRLGTSRGVELLQMLHDPDMATP